MELETRDIHYGTRDISFGNICRRNLDIFAGTAFFWLKSRFIVKESYPNNEIETIMRKQPPQTNNQMISLEAGCSKLNWRLHFFMHHAYVDISLKIADLSTLPFRVFCPTCVHHFIFSTQTFKSKPEHDTKNQLNIC